MKASVRLNFKETLSPEKSAGAEESLSWHHSILMAETGIISPCSPCRVRGPHRSI